MHCIRICQDLSLELPDLGLLCPGNMPKRMPTRWWSKLVCWLVSIVMLPVSLRAEISPYVSYVLLRKSGNMTGTGV